MCGARWRWDEVQSGWQSFSASSRSSLPLPTTANTIPAGAASKARAKAQPKARAQSMLTPAFLPGPRTRSAPDEFDLASQMSQTLEDLENEDEFYDWETQDLLDSNR